MLFWKERKRIGRNETNELLTVKDPKGERVYDPEEVKTTMADYYEKLYGKKEIRAHEHHEKVINDLKTFNEDLTNDDYWYNEVQTEEEVK